MRHLLEFLETREIRANKEAKLEATKSTLQRAWDGASTDNDKEILYEFFEGAMHGLLFLRKNKEWMFNFTSGGWNTIMGEDKETAIERAKEEYKDSKNLIVDERSFSLVSLSKDRYINEMSKFD